MRISEIIDKDTNEFKGIRATNNAYINRTNQIERFISNLAYLMEEFSRSRTLIIFRKLLDFEFDASMDLMVRTEDSIRYHTAYHAMRDRGLTKLRDEEDGA